MQRKAPALGAMVLALALAGCAGGQMSDESPIPSPTGRPMYTVVPTAVPSGQPVDLPDEYWDAILADLDDRGIDGTAELVSAEAVTWNDGALGCPQPGVSYTQALVDGLQVIVQVDDTRYDYRFGSQPIPRLCER